MAAEATAQAIVRAKLVDSPILECSTLSVNDLVDESKLMNLFLECQIKLSVNMKTEAVFERSQTWARAGLGVKWMIDKFIYKQQF